MSSVSSLVSVILPVYNGEHYLAEALDSVLAQSGCVLEVVVVNDGSSDTSANLVAGYIERDPRVRLISQDNAGVTAARNAGIAASNGQYIAFIDQDDRWTADALETHLRAHESNNTAGYTLSHQVCFLQPGASKPDWFKLQQLDQPAAGYLPGALCVQREVFDQVGLFDQRFAISSDADWFARARDAGVPMQVLPQVTLQRRIHSVNQSRHAEIIQEELFQLLLESIRRKREQA